MFSSHLHRWNFQLLAARGQSWPARAVFQSAFLIYDKCNFCCAKCHFSWIETNIIGWGGGRAKYKKYIYSRKGKLNEKNLCTPINPKKYSCYGLKLKFMKEFDKEKNFSFLIRHFPPRWLEWGASQSFEVNVKIK